jgi:hypothetical protein
MKGLCGASGIQDESDGKSDDESDSERDVYE